MITMDDLDRKLNKNNISKTIKLYLEMLKEIPVEIKCSNILELLNTLKRGEINTGPYPLCQHRCRLTRRHLYEIQQEFQERDLEKSTAA